MRILFLSILIVLSFSAKSQAFEGMFVIGTNVAQIDGDKARGYNNFGFTLGAGMALNTPNRWRPSVEFLFSERGSRRSNSEHGSFNVDIDLKYIEIPFILSYKNKYDKNLKIYRFRLDGGFSFAKIFKKSTDVKQNFPIKDTHKKFLNDLDFAIENMSNEDYSFIIGMAYRFNRKIGASLRYTQSLNKMYDQDMEKFHKGLNGFFYTFRLEYQF